MPSSRRPSGKGFSHLELEVLATIEDHAMLAPGQRVAVACSSGADSTALFHLLMRLAQKFGWIVSIAHFNHQLRGSDSDQDEQFVRELAYARGVEFFSTHAGVRQLAAASRANLEATARRLRYKFLQSLIAGGQVDRVAVGHTVDDQAETVLLRLIRGSGPRGLAAIRPVLTPGIIRPLLGVRGQRLREWLAAQGIAWREDASNQDVRLRRNLVRRQLLPALAAINPAVVEALAQTARLSQLDEAFWRRYVAVLAKKHAHILPGEVRIELTALRALPKAASHRLLQWALETAAAHPSSGAAAMTDYRKIKSLHDWAASRQPAPRQLTNARRSLSLPGNLAARRDTAHLIIAATGGTRGLTAKKLDSGYNRRITGPGSIAVAEAGIRCRLEFIDPLASAGAYNGNGQVLFDQSLLVFPLTLRNWRPGDAYRPRGRHKPRKLKELFQRHRIPSHLRADWPVLESAGQVVWSWQFGPAEGFAPQPGCGQAVLLTFSRTEASND